MEIGFIGLGVMGQPMALNLARAGAALVVWNRSSKGSDPFRALGMAVVDAPADVFQRARIVILMLADEDAIDTVLGRGTSGFAAMVAGHTIVNMGSIRPEHSRRLEADIRAAGGRFVEAPVSGSRKPAEAGQLVAMLAGERGDVDEVRPLLAPMCHEAIVCGPVPTALVMKLAVNLFMLTMITGLTEAFHFAERQGLDLRQFLSVIDASPMASSHSRVKGAKLAAADFAAQALATDACRGCQLVAEAARTAAIATPLLDASRALYEETVALGHGQSDMVAVLRAIEARTNAINPGAAEAARADG
jgi:3-hydroxyisobutyrate dehydrogenase